MIDTLFELGQIVGTPEALRTIEDAGQSPHDFLKRHATGDWGEVGSEDKTLNDEALNDDSRLLSSYETKKGDKVWVTTEADRSATTILLPSEY